MLTKELEILLIDDDRIEVMKLNRALGPESNHSITIAQNGSEALDLLKNYQPNIILLDLNMPDTNGIEFLSILKNNESLKHIPTIVLTTSNNNNDISECYKIGIAGYYLKPLKYEDYEEKIAIILKYWSLSEFKIL
ncbi:response regulator [Polaribacter ponticola]|uniref:Response regulator n=1 Tax=Polaribacter ponticola TaxID=2978475 RepID=A0ABT5S7S2_9FLAO|nr:response regulator [Polaribacter sp. MSW5]MDD7914150.1 response regulator [Polaribacter sp. MSW5]